LVATDSQLTQVKKNRCLRIAGIELYLDKLLRSAIVKVLWDHSEWMAISMDWWTDHEI